jgi:pimeloyl-ACP methyl ester carboxylesterase
MTPDWTVTTDDGVTLGATVTEPDGPVRAEVLLLHAMMVDHRTLDRPRGRGLATVLAGRGLRVHRADLRGRGLSDRPTDWSYDDLVYRDVPALLGRFTTPPWVMTHSLGGHVTTAAWATGRVAPRGLVGLAASPWLSSTETSRRRMLAKHVAMGLVAIGGRVHGRMPARRYGLGTVDESHGYSRDLRRFWRTGRWSDREGTDWSVAMRGLRGRILYITSEGDTLFAHPDPTERWGAQAPTARLLRIRHGDHGLDRAPDHMELGADDRSAPIWHQAADFMLAP